MFGKISHEIPGSEILLAYGGMWKSLWKNLGTACRLVNNDMGLGKTSTIHSGAAFIFSHICIYICMYACMHACMYAYA